MEFKIGDKVRVVGNTRDIQRYYGQVGIVISVLRRIAAHPYGVILDGSSYTRAFTADELEREVKVEQDEAIESTRRAYDKARDNALKAFDKAIAPTKKSYDEAVAQANETYEKAVAPARETYREAKVQLMIKGDFY